MHRTGEFEDYPVEAVYHAIGYKPAEAPGITYDEKGAHLANANGDGRITTEPPAVTCVNACMPPGGPSAGRSA